MTMAFLNTIEVLESLKEQGGTFLYTVGRTSFLEEKLAVLDKEALGVVTGEPLKSVTSHNEYFLLA